MSDVTLAFGAADQGVAQTAQRMVAALSKSEAAAKKTEQSFARIGGSHVLKAFGAFQVGHQLVRLASEAMAEYAKKSDAGAAAQERVNRAVSNFKANLGADLAGLTDGYEGLIQKADEFRKGLTDELSFVMNPRNPLGMAREAVEAEMRMTAGKQAKAKAEAMLEDAYGGYWRAQPGGMTEDAAQNLERIRSQKDVQRINEMREKGVFKDLAPGEEDKLRKDVGLRHEAEWDRIHREFAERKETVQFTLDSTIKEAQIAQLRAQGRDREARGEQVVLDTSRKILDVKKNELLTLDQKIAAVRAIGEAGQAELGMTVPGYAPHKYNPSIGGGFGGDASLRRMVLAQTVGMRPSQSGNNAKQFEEISKNTKQQVDILTWMKNSMQNSGGARFE